MSKIEIKAVIDTDIADERDALISFLQMLTPNSGVEANPEPIAPKAKPKTRKAATKKEEETQEEETQEEETQEEETQEEETQEEETQEETLSAASLKEFAMGIVAPTNPNSKANRNAIRAKLDLLGATNIPTLDKKHFAEMKSFLDKLV